MADKSIGELIPATSVTPTDLFVLEQNNTAKKLTGQVLENWLVSFADGHGGIQSIEKQETSGLNDTYRITLADTTTFDFVVTNGRSITGISKTSTGGLVDTYTISYNDDTTSTFTVTNGEKGDKGDNAYTWFKYASEKPTSSGSSMGDEPDNWLGVYSGNKSEPPTDPMEYTWSLIKGEKGQTGDPATIVTNKTEYQVSDSGTIIPSGIWSTSIPVVTPGKFLWARTTTQFNTGTPNYAYSISRFGIDGTGSVVTVNGVSPDEFGNVELTAEQLECLGLAGGTMTGPIHMSGQFIDGLNEPTNETEAARKGYVDASVRKAAPRNLLDNSDFRNPVNQRGKSNYTGAEYTIDRWRTWSAGNIVVGDGYVGVSGAAVYQYFNIKDLTTPYTAMVMLQDGTKYVYSGNFEDGFGNWGQTLWCGSEQEGSEYFRIEGAINSNILYVALYEGTYTADTLPEYRPKGYAAELAECQRYYRDIHLRGETGFLLNTSTAVFNLGFMGMRIANPTVQVITGDSVVTTDGYFPVLTSGAHIADGSCLNLQVDNTLSLPEFTPVGLFAAHIVLSADL